MSTFWPATPWIVGHRGSPRDHPENSQESFDAAIDGGADMVELDVRRTSDGVLVVFHDATLRRYSSLRRVPVESLTYDEICEITTARSPIKRHGRLISGAPPRFEDVVAAVAGRTRLDVEIKAPGYEADVVEILRRHMPRRSYVITSFKEEVIATVKKLAPEIPVGLLLGSRSRSSGSIGVMPFGRAERCGADFLVPHHILVDASLLARAEKRGMPVMVYTVNRRRRLETLLRDGRIAGIITDVPAQAVSLRNELS